MQADRTNGFRVRGFNADIDRLAVQSTHQSTFWPFQKRRWAFGFRGWQDVGLARQEIIVMRPYGAEPEIEIEALGGPHGVLIVNLTQTRRLTLRNGQRLRHRLKKDESVVIQTEDWREPRNNAVAQAHV